jgi:hypothetical protein
MEEHNKLPGKVADIQTSSGWLLLLLLLVLLVLVLLLVGRV